MIWKFRFLCFRKCTIKASIFTGIRTHTHSIRLFFTLLIMVVDVTADATTSDCFGRDYKSMWATEINWQAEDNSVLTPEITFRKAQHITDCHWSHLLSMTAGECWHSSALFLCVSLLCSCWGLWRSLWFWVQVLESENRSSAGCENRSRHKDKDIFIRLYSGIGMKRMCEQSRLQ